MFSEFPVYNIVMLGSLHEDGDVTLKEFRKISLPVAESYTGLLNSSVTFTLYQSESVIFHFRQNL